MNEYVDYLKGYIVRFGLDSEARKGWEGTVFDGQSRIQLHTRVVGVQKLAKGLHRVQFIKGEGVWCVS